MSSHSSGCSVTDKDSNSCYSLKPESVRRRSDFFLQCKRTFECPFDQLTVRMTFDDRLMDLKPECHHFTAKDWTELALDPYK